MGKLTTPLKNTPAVAVDDSDYDSISFLFNSPNKKKLLGKWFHATRKGSDRKKYVHLADKALEVLHKRVDPNKLKTKGVVLSSLADEYEDGSSVYGSDELLETVTATTAATSGDPIVRLVPLIKLMTAHLARTATSTETLSQLLSEQNHNANIAIVKAAGKSSKEIELSKMSETNRKKMVAAGKQAEKAEKAEKPEKVKKVVKVVEAKVKKVVKKKAPAKTRQAVALAVEEVEEEEELEEDD
ncbi:hypothetical protein BCR33DRAFT_740147 [Rhizoclosmatium globosum]|uniref:Uncharacterized protein n=1 Tax=Rhizoclosmatium globosum TaxID=329046 RepID=A0A1Y2C150_9FUNG|nr:hypothetical protein BCR33DRAFT_740147 [Rhizoclosmatium globosum]|eukprot:ORY40758.1 hypothetical protein BCR33DRAFT_740147 [Rhizoclosmatium globosum]